MTFKSKILLSVAAAMTLLGFSGQAFAGDIVNEVRLGIYDHDSPVFRSRQEPSEPDINVEVLFNSPDFLSWMANPRPHLGTTINTGGGTSMAYAGLTWDYFFTEALFVEGSFGGAIHNGETDKSTSSSRNYGCRVNFHENASLGYKFTGGQSLMLTLEHMSNASLCDDNDGLTNLGVRYGLSF
ncbi:MAG: acyloxyacyl hydrolase [Rhizobiales bacterium]|nr:acyloxyacyl hydrolase [Hyphomicrobiales bacterium]